jgi:hypothetical protein
MNAQPDPSHGESGPSRITASQAPAQGGENSESHARLLADAAHERDVVQKMIFTTFTGLIAVIAAFFTTILQLSIFWRNLWLTVCIAFAVLMFAGIFQFCGHIDSSTSPKIIKH